MIAKTTIELRSVTNEFEPLVLAPFSQEDMAAVVPADPTALEHLPRDVSMLYSLNPKKVFESQVATSATVWGIFKQTVEPPNFVGRVSLCPLEASPSASQAYNYQCEVTREVGTLLLLASEQGKGIGTRAKLAAVSFALEHEDNVHSFLAMTSERNKAAQRSLEKVGFEMTLPRYEKYFPNGAATQTWAVADPEAQAVFAEHGQVFYPNEIARLAAGWERYRAAMQDVQLEITGQ